MVSAAFFVVASLLFAWRFRHEDFVKIKLYKNVCGKEQGQTFLFQLEILKYLKEELQVPKFQLQSENHEIVLKKTGHNLAKNS